MFTHGGMFGVTGSIILRGVMQTVTGVGAVGRYKILTRFQVEMASITAGGQAYLHPAISLVGYILQNAAQNTAAWYREGIREIFAVKK